MPHAQVSEAAFNREVGQRIRTARRDAELTQQGLAAAVALSRGSIANIERGDQAPPPFRLSLIADALSVDLASLLPSVEWRASIATRLDGHLSSEHAQAVANVRAFAARKRIARNG